MSRAVLTPATKRRLDAYRDRLKERNSRLPTPSQRSLIEAAVIHALNTIFNDGASNPGADD